LKGHLKQLGSYGFHRGYFAKRFPQTSRRLAYFLPSAVSLWLLLGWLTMRLPVVGWVYPVTALAYLLMVALVSFSTNLVLFILTFAGIVASHLAYGLSFLRGLFAREIRTDRS
jgi:hypothetical protein